MRFDVTGPPNKTADVYEIPVTLFVTTGAPFTNNLSVDLYLRFTHLTLTPGDKGDLTVGADGRWVINPDVVTEEKIAPNAIGLTRLQTLAQNSFCRSSFAIAVIVNRYLFFGFKGRNRIRQRSRVSNQFVVDPHNHITFF